MLEKDQVDRLNEIAGRFFDLQPNALAWDSGPPFDVSKPNLHDNKADFLAEVAHVDALVKALQTATDLLRAGFMHDHADHNAALAVSQFVDGKIGWELQSLEVTYLSDLVLHSAAKAGLTICTTLSMFRMLDGLVARKQELESQRNDFWGGQGRSPNHYARAIALRFARLIARKTGKKPTFGTSRDGGHPSTEFGRALEEIFEILGVNATVKHPATWALKQLTEDDLKPEIGGLLGGLLGPVPAAGTHRNALADFVAKGTDQ